ncbi:HEAT repeat domain-containing protein [Halorarum halophilum]|uniref:HEAT repeat domain-containing protein n=1 Tax=Halorarum halophilum TaxID=2743090 RepID=A0A7D5GY92_9EURY|nr:HEAT repeat domain-containing protein [Halobaculum halophilum]QLG26673.1 HEAT repeat domain-containing protein [Halobaculum halophilum]
MSDDEPAEDPTEEAGEVAPVVSPEDLEARLDEAAESLENAETESDLDEVETTLDAVEADLEAADLPEPDEDDEDAEDPREELESRLSELRDELEEKRGPYAEEVVADIEDAQATLRDTRWTENGAEEIPEAVDSFLEAVNWELETNLSRTGTEPEGLAADLDGAIEAVEDADLDPDEDAETISALLDATEELRNDLEDAEEWDDLETNEQLRAQGFYDVLGHYKDFPPEWAALKEWEKRGNVEMVLLALDSLQSDFMERHALEAITRMNDQGAFEAMHQRAGKRDKPSIRALGKMGAEDAVETLVEYVDADSDPALQKVTFKALGEIGHEDAVQPLADKLVMDNDEVRPLAVRSLGLIGDTRAVDPLADAASDDDSDTVRAAALWALRQIGTEEALEAAAEHVDDRTFIVQTEAEKARDALDTDEGEPERATA